MENKRTNEDKSSWAIGGTTIFLKTSVLIFVASLIIGIGAGLVIVPIISRGNKMQ